MAEDKSLVLSISLSLKRRRVSVMEESSLKLIVFIRCFEDEKCYSSANKLCCIHCKIIRCMVQIWSSHFRVIKKKIIKRSTEEKRYHILSLEGIFKSITAQLNWKTSIHGTKNRDVCMQSPIQEKVNTFIS